MPPYPIVVREIERCWSRIPASSPADQNRRAGDHEVPGSRSPPIAAAARIDDRAHPPNNHDPEPAEPRAKHRENAVSTQPNSHREAKPKHNKLIGERLQCLGIIWGKSKNPRVPARLKTVDVLSYVKRGSSPSRRPERHAGGPGMGGGQRNVRMSGDAPPNDHGKCATSKLSRRAGRHRCGDRSITLRQTDRRSSFTRERQHIIGKWPRCRFMTGLERHTKSYDLTRRIMALKNEI